MASAKIKRMKIMHIINDNAVRGRLSENDLTRKFIARNICDVKYSRFTILQKRLTLKMCKNSRLVGVCKALGVNDFG